ncbi:MAG: TylF/MycF/NovP-related O-methyltransferase [Chloroflexales bacterium]
MRGKALIGGLRALIRRAGIDVVRYTPAQGRGLPPDFDPETARVFDLVQPYTLTTPERIFALCAAVRYIVRAGVPGDIVECGVWRGGSMMAAAYTLRDVGDVGRRLVLFDTFEGMSPPDQRDVSYTNEPAADRLARSSRADPRSVWAYAPLEDVRANMASTGYPTGQIAYVPGKVEETIPTAAPGQIALLRLDTDWYVSTRHELEHLFPRIAPGGVLIVDDYGHWRGARQALDEYLAAHGVQLLLNRIDYTGRIAVIPPQR